MSLQRSQIVFIDVISRYGVHCRYFTNKTFATRSSIEVPETQVKERRNIHADCPINREESINAVVGL